MWQRSALQIKKSRYVLSARKGKAIIGFAQRILFVNKQTGRRSRACKVPKDKCVVRAKLWKQPQPWFQTASSKTGKKIEFCTCAFCSFWNNREKDLYDSSSHGVKGWNNQIMTSPNAGGERCGTFKLTSRESTGVWNRALKRSFLYSNSWQRGKRK